MSAAALLSYRIPSCFPVWDNLPHADDILYFTMHVLMVHRIPRAYITGAFVFFIIHAEELMVEGMS